MRSEKYQSGGGNGAGAVPISEIYEQVTGKSAVSYYAFAIIILTIANIMSILAGAFLNAFGDKYPSLTGDKKTLLRNSSFNAEDSEEAEPTLSDLCGAILVIFGSYAVGQLFSGYILPTILGELVNACTVSNVVIAFLIVLGAIVGSALVGQLVGFYPIDSAITAGLCMANRGGNGDVAVLGAAKRMDLMAYAQLSSRLGGGIVLIIASFLFSFLM